MTVGMVSSWMNAVLDAARARGLTVRDLVLVQDNRYTMEGSALNGTMTGGALPVELDVRIDADADEDAVREMVAAAVRGPPSTTSCAGRTCRASPSPSTAPRRRWTGPRGWTAPGRPTPSRCSRGSRRPTPRGCRSRESRR